MNNFKLILKKLKLYESDFYDIEFPGDIRRERIVESIYFYGQLTL